MFTFVLLASIFVFVDSLDCDNPELTSCQATCRNTYGGQKNYFNQTDHYCYSTPLCTITQVYVTSDNSCRNITGDHQVTKQSSEGLPSTIGNYTIVQKKPVKCIHGTEYTDTLGNQYCNCQIGYQDSSQQDDQSVITKCSERITNQTKTIYQQINYSNQTQVEQNLNGQLELQKNQSASGQNSQNSLDGINYIYLFIALCIFLGVCLTLSLYFCCRKN